MTEATDSLEDDPSLPLESLFCSSVPSLPRAFDSTMLGLAKTCLRKFKYIIIDGWRPRGFAAHLAFGTAVHKVKEVYDKDKAFGLSHDDALLNAVQFCMGYGYRDSNGVFYPYDAAYTAEPTKTRDTLLRSMIWFLDQFKNDHAQTVILSNGKPAVEHSFKINLPDFPTPDGDPFILCGHLDRLVTIDGDYYFMDTKTTKSALTPYYFASFNPNNQMSLYFAAAQLALREPAKGGIIDAMQIGVGFTRFARHPINRTRNQQREWLQDTYFWINTVAQAAAEDNWPMNDTSCSDFGGCPFRSICALDPSVREQFLKHEGFVKEPWNPLISR